MELGALTCYDKKLRRGKDCVRGGRGRVRKLKEGCWSGVEVRRRLKSRCRRVLSALAIWVWAGMGAKCRYQ